MPQKLKKFCKLSKYVEVADQELYNAIDDICSLHLLKPRNPARGITLLFPQEKSYRKQIIDLAHSNEPEKAVSMLKALVLPNHYEDESEFDGNVVNLLGQKVAVEKVDKDSVKLSNGLSLKKDESFIPMGHRDNMSVFLLSGKGEMPLDAPSAEMQESKVKRGGAVAKKREVQELLCKEYRHNQSCNVYMKKVYMQLRMIKDKYGEDSCQKLQKCLGNEEISDSYLLDMFCEKNCPECFNKLYDCLGNGKGLPEELSEIKRDHYLDIKDSVCNEDREVINPRPLLRGVRSPMDIRAKVKDMYKDNKCLGKDLFIVLTNMMKEIWCEDMSKGDRDTYENFCYLATEVFSDPEDLAKQEFDIARDVSLWGNLLKSDVFKFKPKGRMTGPPQGYEERNVMPSPLDLTPYSLNYLQYQRMMSVKGGSKHAHKYLP